jgi:hypothetical protein
MVGSVPPGFGISSLSYHSGSWFRQEHAVAASVRYFAGPSGDELTATKQNVAGKGIMETVFVAMNKTLRITAPDSPSSPLVDPKQYSFLAKYCEQIPQLKVLLKFINSKHKKDSDVLKVMFEMTNINDNLMKGLRREKEQIEGGLMKKRAFKNVVLLTECPTLRNYAEEPELEPFSDVLQSKKSLTKEEADKLQLAVKGMLDKIEQEFSQFSKQLAAWLKERT